MVFNSANASLLMRLHSGCPPTSEGRDPRSASSWWSHLTVLPFLQGHFLTSNTKTHHALATALGYLRTRQWMPPVQMPGMQTTEGSCHKNIWRRVMQRSHHQIPKEPIPSRCLYVSHFPETDHRYSPEPQFWEHPRVEQLGCADSHWQKNWEKN